jgi:hypothetical protein
MKGARAAADMVWVPAAGPAMNIALANLAALAFHLIGYLPETAAQWVAKHSKDALIINVVLAAFLYTNSVLSKATDLILTFSH